MTAKKPKTARTKITATSSTRRKVAQPKPSKSRTPLSRARTKRALIKDLLERPDGATIRDLMKATGWQEHSVRAALTGLRHDSCTIVRTKAEGGPSRFRIDAS